MFSKEVVLVRTIRFIYISEIASTINITDVVSLFQKMFFSKYKISQFRQCTFQPFGSFEKLKNRKIKTDRRIHDLPTTEGSEAPNYRFVMKDFHFKIQNYLTLS